MEEKIVKLLEIIYETYNKDVGKIADVLTSINPNMANYSDKVSELVRKHLSFDKLKPGLIEIYSEYFNETEIDGIIAFYSSESGVKFMKHQSDIYVRTQQLSQKILSESREALDKEFEEIFKQNSNTEN